MPLRNMYSFIYILNLITVFFFFFNENNQVETIICCVCSIYTCCILRTIYAGILDQVASSDGLPKKILTARAF